MIRPILQSSGGVPTVLCGISVDFEPVDNLGAVSFNPAAQKEAIWDIAKWDKNIWSGGLSNYKNMARSHWNWLYRFSQYDGSKPRY